MRLINYLIRKYHERSAKYANESTEERAIRQTAIATIVIAILTVVMAVTSILQWNVMDGQLKEMRDSSIQAESMVRATQTLAAATGAANVIAANAIKIAESSDRPWIGVDAVIPGALEVGKDYIVNIVIKNSGKSPAIDLNVCANVELIVDKIPAATGFSENEIGRKLVSKGCKYIQHAVLLPNSTYATRPFFDAPLMQAGTVNEINSGRIALATWGEIYYRDSISSSQHKTWFCYVYTPKFNTFSPCTTGNGAR